MCQIVGSNVVSTGSAATYIVPTRRLVHFFRRYNAVPLVRLSFIFGFKDNNTRRKDYRTSKLLNINFLIIFCNQLFSMVPIS